MIKTSLATRSATDYIQYTHTHARSREREYLGEIRSLTAGRGSVDGSHSAHIQTTATRARNRA